MMLRQTETKRAACGSMNRRSLQNMLLLIRCAEVNSSADNVNYDSVSRYQQLGKDD